MGTGRLLFHPPLGHDCRASEEFCPEEKGRGKKLGKVLLQTYFPDQQIIKSIQLREREIFIEKALKERKNFNIPPFGFMTDGLDDTSFVDADGDRWFTDEYGDKGGGMDYMWNYR